MISSLFPLMFTTIFFKKNHNFTNSIAINVYQVSMLAKNIAVYRKINTESTFIFPFYNICGLNHWQVCTSLKPDTCVLCCYLEYSQTIQWKTRKSNISSVTQELLQWTTDWLGKSVNFTHFSFVDGIVKNWLSNRIANLGQW